MEPQWPFSIVSTVECLIPPMAPIIPLTDSGGLTNYEVNKVKLRVIFRGIQVNENPSYTWVPLRLDLR